jgi:O-antigen/teichoic acid export membrane protein
MGVAVLGVALLLHGSARMAFIALGLTLPGLLLQDSWRFAFFAAGRGAYALVNDMVWAIALVIGLAYLHVSGHETVFWAVFVWGAAAGVGALLGPLQAKVKPKVLETRQWLKAHWDLAPRYVIEGTTNSASTQVANYTIGLLLGLAAVGAVQAASTLMGPVMIVVFGMGLVLLPEGVRIVRTAPHYLYRVCILVSVAISGFAAVWGIVLLIVLPMGAGEALFKGLWHSTSPLVLPSVLYVMAVGATSGAGLGMHALAAARRSLRASLITSALYVIGVAIGGAAGGTVGAVSGGAVGMWIGVIVFWWELHIAMQENDVSTANQEPEE